MNKEKAYIIDIETYPNCFLFAVTRADFKHQCVFEVSFRSNEIDRVLKCLDYLADNEHFMVSFNGIGFDYPILHNLLVNRKKLNKDGEKLASYVYDLAQKQIDSFKGEGFPNTIRAKDVIVKQMDLYKIHHMNNSAKATSLKMIEFNMRMRDIEDLPYAVGTFLTSEQIDVLKDYNLHDIKATVEFFNLSQGQIDFRIAMSEKYGVDWINFDDTKIGAEYFMMRLQEAGVELYSVDSKGRRSIKQTKRPVINLKDCILPYLKFTNPAFQALRDWFAKQKITETKGAFSDIDESELGEVAKYAELVEKKKKFKGKPSEADVARFKLEHPLGWVEEQELKATETVLIDGVKTKVPKKSYWMVWRVSESLNVVVDDFKYVGGLGGLHGSIANKVIKSNSNWVIRDFDCKSYYPHLSFKHRVYPKHLTEKFCDIYQDMYLQRSSYSKHQPENAMLKLALNGTYGKSNDKYSVFYDPQFTMTITVSGQLSLLMLIDMWQQSGVRLKVAMANTDGITVCYHKEDEERVMQVSKEWEALTLMELEAVDYSAMYIRDVNSYIGVYTNGKAKRKGAYQYEDLMMHQNQSCLIIPRCAEAVMLHGADPEAFIRACDDPFDFVLRTKVPRSSKLVLRFTDEFNGDTKDVAQQNVCRYYPSTSSGKLIKLMPALEGNEEKGDRELSIDSDYNVKTCNCMDDFSFDDLDYSYYIKEVEKLLIGS